MSEKIITSTQNTLVKQIRKLHLAKERKQQNLLLLEGTNLLEAACQANYHLSAVCCTTLWQQLHPHWWQQVQTFADRVELVSQEVLQAIATTVNPDGVVATAIRPPQAIIDFSNLQLGLVLERLQDPGNLGTIIRTATATNTNALWLSQDSVDLYNPKVLRSSVGEWFRLPMAVSSDLPNLISQARAQGLQTIATLPQASKPYWQIDFRRPTLILLGNEGAGLSQELIALTDEQVQIPLAAPVESLNVAIAAALLLYESVRQNSVS